MWFVRRSLLGAGSAPLISLAQLGRMFWAAVVASTLAPRVQPGKLLSHSSRVVGLLAQQAEEQARRAAARALSGTAPRRRRRRRRLAEAPWRASNVSKRGWCLRADPCPLHALTHPPAASEAAARCASADGEVGLAAGGHNAILQHHGRQPQHPGSSTGLRSPPAEPQPQLQLNWQWNGRHVLGMTQRRAGVLEAETRLLDDSRPLGGATRTRTLLHGRYAEASARLGLPTACALAQQLRDSCIAEQPGCAAYVFETGLVQSDAEGHGHVATCGARRTRAQNLIR